jgi:hypothetical protein
MLFRRNRIENNLTSTLLSNPMDSRTDVATVLVHPDFIATLKAAPACLQDYIMQKSGVPLRRLIRLAFYEKDAHLSSLAVRVLAQPKGTFLMRIAGSDIILIGMNEFLRSDEASRDPVHVGHYGAVFLALLRCDYDRLTSAVPLDVCLREVFQRLDIVGWQELLTSLLLDWPTKWVSGDTARGFQGLAREIRIAADAGRWPIVAGAFSSLLSFVKEQAVSGLDPAVQTAAFRASANSGRPLFDPL